MSPAAIAVATSQRKASMRCAALVRRFVRRFVRREPRHALPRPQTQANDNRQSQAQVSCIRIGLPECACRAHKTLKQHECRRPHLKDKLVEPQRPLQGRATHQAYGQPAALPWAKCLAGDGKDGKHFEPFYHFGGCFAQIERPQGRYQQHGKVDEPYARQRSWIEAQRTTAYAVGKPDRQRCGQQQIGGAERTQFDRTAKRQGGGQSNPGQPGATNDEETGAHRGNQQPGDWQWPGRQYPRGKAQKGQ